MNGVNAAAYTLRNHCDEVVFFIFRYRLTPQNLIFRLVVSEEGPCQQGKSAEIGRIASKHVKVPPTSRKAPSSQGSDKGSDSATSVVELRESDKKKSKKTNKSPSGTMNHYPSNERPQSETEEMDTQEGGSKIIFYIFVQGSKFEHVVE